MAVKMWRKADFDRLLRHVKNNPATFAGIEVEEITDVQFWKNDILLLIDDRTKHGADEFGDRHIHFREDPRFPDWQSVVAYLMK